MAIVKLSFRTQQVVTQQFGNWPLKFIRLVAKVQFQLPDASFTEPWIAVFDTGAPMSVLPLRLWRMLAPEIHVPDATFGGISRRKVCSLRSPTPSAYGQIRCSIGTVRGRLIDEDGNRTRIYDFPTFLAKIDRVPLIIGFAEMLERFTNYFNYPTHEAWVEEVFLQT
jgi:hypothetical protein